MSGRGFWKLGIATYQGTTFWILLLVLAFQNAAALEAFAGDAKGGHEGHKILEFL